MDTRLNEWARLKFVDPSQALPKLKEVQQLLVQSDLPDNVKNLRTNKLKRYREGWEAAIFCYGMGKLLGTTVFLIPYESSSDYDVISKYVKNSEEYFCPIQIKEVVPKKLNPHTSINQEITKLSKYPTSNDVVVVIHDNRPGKLNLTDLIVPKLELAELWVLGTSSADQSKWFIAGNLLEEQNGIYEFDYPK